jgi:hypothetical protein
MNIRTLVLSMTSASALLACQPDLTIGGQGDGGSDAGPVVVLRDSGSGFVVDAGPEASVTLEAGSVDTSHPEAGTASLIVFDGGVGGLCASVDVDAAAADTADAANECGCTRRPGSSGAYFQCPPGIGNNASVTLDPQSTADTDLKLEGRQGPASGVAATIYFAPGAVQTPTVVTLIETSIAPPNDILDWSPVYAAEPLGLTLGTGAGLELPWSNTLNAVPRDLAVWFSPDGSCFTPLPSSYTNAGFDQATITQLGYFIVGNPRTSATAACP